MIGIVPEFVQSKQTYNIFIHKMLLNVFVLFYL